MHVRDCNPHFFMGHYHTFVRWISNTFNINAAVSALQGDVSTLAGSLGK